MPFKFRNLFSNFGLSNKKVTQSEAKFQAFIKYAGDAIFMIDPAYRITEANDSACKLLNYTDKELQRMKIYELMTADEQQAFASRSEIIEKEGGSLHERKLKRKDGSIILTEVNVRPIEGIGYITIIRDITERKKTEAEILERESLLTALFDNIEGSLALYDANKKIVLFNNHFAYNYNLITNRYPSVGDGAHDHLSEEKKKEPARLMDRALKGNKQVFEKDYLNNGRSVSFRTSFNPVMNDGVVTGITSFSLDITRSREAEKKIRQSEQRFKSIIAVSNTGGWEYHNDSRFLWCSTEYFKMLGRKQSDYDLSGAANLKETWIKLLHPEDKERATNHFAEYLKNGSVGTYENYFRMLHLDGSWVWILSRGQTLRDGYDKLTNITVGTHIDITEHKKAEIKIQENEEKFRLSFMTSQDTFYIGTLEEGRVIDVNNSFYDLFGYTRDEVIGKTSAELGLYVYAQERAGMVVALKANGHIKDLELTCRKKSGELFIASVTVNLWQQNNEQVIMAVIRDITEKKRIEKELIESEIRFREVLENSVSASYKRNLLTNAYDYLSPVFRKIAGYTQEEMNSMPIEMVIGMMHPDDVQPVRDGIIKAITEQGDAENVLEYRFKHKTTGKYRWLNDEFTVIKDAEGKAVSLIGSVSDITERKGIETELIESKEQMALFVEYSPASLAMFDTDMRYIATSRRWLVDYNIGDQQIIGKTHYEIFPEITQDWKDIHQRCLNGAVESNDEDSFVRADGTMDWLKWEVRPWHKGSGGIGGIIMFTEVITERKESELKFKNLVEKSLVGVYIIQKGRYVYVNPKFEQILGYTQDEMLNMENVRNIAYEGYVPDALIEWRKKVDTGIIDDFHIELQYQKKDGTIIWAEVNCSQTFYKGAKAILGTFQDITERKNAEAVIKEQAGLFGAIIENTKESIWLLSPDLKVLQFNKTAKDRLWKNSGKEICLGADFREFLHPGGEDVFYSTFNDALSGKHTESEFGQKDIHGEIFWLRTKMYPIYDQGKKMIGITALTEDITERKTAEENIKQSEANYRQLFDNSPAPMWVINEKTSAIIQVNKAAIRNYGFSEEEFLAMMISQITPGERAPIPAADMIGMSFKGSQRHVKKSGELIDVVTSSIPIRINGENNTLLIAIDVTEKNLYEQKLTKAAIKVQEDERYEIGGELHDNVCQILAGSLMTLGMMKDALPKQSIDIFDLTRKYINQATSEIRNLSHRLAPAFFDMQTLEEAILELLKSVNVENRYMINLNVDARFNKEPLNRDLQLNLYRILQEQLRNIMKHSKATKIEVAVAVKKSDLLQMKITDNGVGFNVKAVKGGIGLANMNRRVQLFSGTFTIYSAVGKGCRALIEIPLLSAG